jgi:bifunctional oligoribonuclease and PAP phosphatase NrnA
MNQQIKEIKDLVNNADSIVILPHIMPDGDALGSAISLALGLKQIIADVKVVLEDSVPSSYEFLPKEDVITILDNYKGNPSLSIAVDCSDTERLGKRQSIFQVSESTINIDHHRSNIRFADINYVDEKASATGELIFNLLQELDTEITSDMAMCLYVAISTDTGSFRYSNTTPKTHEIVAQIISKPADYAAVNRKLYDEIPLSKLKLLGRAIDSLELLMDEQVGFMHITESDITDLNIKESDFDGIINYCLNIETVEVAVLIKEIKDEKFKVGLRSKRMVDVSSIAFEFHGGGHIRASGFTIESTLDEVKDKLLKKIAKQLIKGWD